MDLLEEHGIRFILNVKQGSHKQLFESLKSCEKLKKVHRHEVVEEIGDKIKKRRVHSFEYVHQMRIKKDSEKFYGFINYRETTTWVDKDGNPKEKVIRFSWITDLSIHERNLMKLMRAGRCRWKIENETFNTLKNQGYNFEHNFGHGYKHLTTNFMYLMMLAFLFDQIQRKSYKLFKEASRVYNNKITILRERMRNLYFLVDDLNSFEELYGGIIHGLQFKPPLNSK